MNEEIELRKILSSILQVDCTDINFNESLSFHGKVDSLTYIRLIVEIEKKIGVSIEIIDLLSTETIDNLLKLIIKQKFNQ